MGEMDSSPVSRKEVRIMAAHLLEQIEGVPQKLRQQRLDVYPICQQPGCAHKATDVDHITPKIDGGSGIYENIRSLCALHHRGRTALDQAGR
jgi:hypothetical protein